MGNTKTPRVFLDKLDPTSYGAEIACYNSAGKSFYVRYYANGQSKAGNFTNFHTHGYNRFCVHLNGSMVFSVNGVEYQPHPGDITIARAGEPHTIMRIDDDNYEYLQVDFPLDAFDEMDFADVFNHIFDSSIFCENNFVVPDDEKRDTIMKSTRKIITFLSSESVNKLLVFSYVIQLIYAINASFDNAKANPVGHKMSENVHKAVQYIYSNLSTIKTVEEVANHINVSTSYLTRLFKSNLGCTPYEYIVDQRIEYAKTLMCYKGENVSEACRKSGFNDYSNFIALFKRKTGQTPSVYKKTNS